MMKHQLILFAFVLLLTGCGNGGDAGNNENPLDKAVAVYTQELSPQTFRHYINIQGTVESDRTILLAAKAPATVQEIKVKAGQHVKKNQVLAVLDGEILKSQISTLETQIELARDMFERQQKVHEQNIGSEVEYLQAKNQLEALEKQKITLNEQYDNYFIKATIDGLVDRVMLKEGESIGPERPAFQIVNSDDLKITAEISEAYIQNINEGNEVEISFTSLDRVINTKLDVVSKVINASNRTFGVEIYIDNPDGNIRPNMITKLRINDYTAENQILIPVNAMQISNGDRFVYVAEKDGEYYRAVRKDITPGLSSGNDLIVLEGLEAGDQLITTGYNNLAENDYVVIK